MGQISHQQHKGFKKKNRTGLNAVIDTKESASIADPLEKIAMKSYGDHSDSEIDKMLIPKDLFGPLA